MEWVRPVEAIEEAHAVRRNMPDRGPHTPYAVTDFPLEDYGTGVVTSQTVRFLEEHQEDPFALWVSYPDPHAPYEAPKKYADMFPPDVIDLPPWGEDDKEAMPERNRVLYHMLSREDEPMENVYGYLACYYGMVRFLDDGVGQILDALERLELRDNTIVVLCADHGDFAGEHCMGQKGGVFYDCLTHIPMIVSYPSHIPEGEVEEGMVNLVDVVPTLLSLQGITVPRCMQGEPLPTVTDTLPRDTAFSEYGAGGPPFTMEDLRDLSQPYGRYALMQSLRWREAEGRRKMVRTREWKYVHDPMGDKDELYDLVNDPWELTNVIDDPTHDLVVRDLQARLADWSIMTEDGHCVPLPGEKYYDLPWER
jgi:arylsulfatase A-like enzyme